jgi:hypothetical protein
MRLWFERDAGNLYTIFITPLRNVNKQKLHYTQYKVQGEWHEDIWNTAF